MKRKGVNISVSGPEYGTYTNLPSGFALYANIENTTHELMEVSLVDFYIISAGRQQSPLYCLDGYSFEQEHLLANTLKTVGKIFTTSGLNNDKLYSGDYIIIKLKINAKEFRMFKFVYEVGFLEEGWRLDDYSEVSL